MFKILALHTAIRDAVGTLPIKAVDETALPKVDYLALGHLHINYCKSNSVYSGPIFPNNLTELEELQGGSFYIYDNGKIKREEIKLKNVLNISIELNNAFLATDEIIKRLSQENLKDKILILKVYGFLEKGKITDIDFSKIESFISQQKAYVFLKSTTKLQTAQQELSLDFSDASELEEQIIRKFGEAHPSIFNNLVFPLVKSLQIEKAEDEKSTTFQERLLSEIRKVLQV